MFSFVSGKRQSAANPAARYSREAEFLSLSSQPAPYEHFCEDIRYTADGYPVRTVDNAANTTFSANNAQVIAKSEQAVQWPPCLPAKLSRGHSLEERGAGRKCVGAQTQTEEVKVFTGNQNKPVNKSLCNIAKLSETLTESPDEGYEGESVETSSNTC